jgi:hypothetical protein
MKIIAFYRQLTYINKSTFDCVDFQFKLSRPVIPAFAGMTECNIYV